MNNTMRTVFMAMRPPFLILAVISVLLGAATAYFESGSLNIDYLLLALLGAVAAHISVNAFNEYFDFKSGLDLLTDKTPFSGGSGALPANPGAAGGVFVAASGALLITIGVGAYFLMVHGMALLPLGLIGVVLVAAYTPHINRHPLLCLLAPGLGFGPVMVVGSHFVLTGHYSLPPLLASLLPFFLVNNLLLLNQFPDVEADRKSGRRTAPIVYGLGAGANIYALFLLLAAAAVIASALADKLPPLSLLSLAGLLPALRSLQGARLFDGNTEALLPGMALNVVAANGAPLLLAATLWFAA